MIKRKLNIQTIINQVFLHILRFIKMKKIKNIILHTGLIYNLLFILFIDFLKF